MKKLVLLCFLEIILLFALLVAVRYVGYKVAVTIFAVPIIIVFILIILSVLKIIKHRC